ncbi:MAG: glutathione S-transferase N-terminal domain-containing protein [Pseudomonadales bacterium]
MGILAKRSSMTFFSDATSHYCHRVRIVLAEKGVTVDIIDVTNGQLPEDIAALNPYNTLPTLVDRELVLYEPNVMMEYLDERFPHPPLLPVYPVARGESRQYIYRIERDWSRLVDMIEADAPGADEARKELREGLIAIGPIFGEKPFFMSDEFTLIDCCMAPILWRLSKLKIVIPETRQTRPLKQYMKSLFERESFQASLSEREREMREAN